MNLFRYFLKLLGLRRASRPEDIPRQLDSETLARVMDEARNLRDKHRIDVKPLSPGELPIPRRATDDTP